MTAVFRERNQWMVSTHLSMLKAGTSMTAKEVGETYGRPAGNTSVGLRMCNAAKDGWFSTEMTGNGRERRYTAVDKYHGLDAPPNVKRSSNSTHAVKFEQLGRGFHPVNSVFDLARWL